MMKTPAIQPPIKNKREGDLMQQKFNPASRIAVGLKALAVGVVALGFAGSASAQEFPEKPIEIVIHAKYGGGTDTTARMMMIRSRRNLGGDMVVVSKRGGGGAKAQTYANGKPRDGYTVLALTQTHLYTIVHYSP
jgi:tripartite-type tricarboxylate transporter receptor subunit TctC